VNYPYISRLCAWAPGVGTRDEWEQWAHGELEITIGALAPTGPQSPDIGFTDPMFRRRLSQISKMTIRVVHDLLPAGENAKILFVSFRGELSRQYQINRMLIEDNAILPAAFSLSVFNAPGRSCFHSPGAQRRILRALSREQFLCRRPLRGAGFFFKRPGRTYFRLRRRAGAA